MVISGSVWSSALTFLLNNIYIRFGTKLFRRIVGIPMGTNCAPLVSDLFLFCYERKFIISLSEEKQSEVIKTFSQISRYLDDLLNNDNKYLRTSMVWSVKIYPSELQSNKANFSETESPCFGFAFVCFRWIYFIKKKKKKKKKKKW